MPTDSRKRRRAPAPRVGAQRSENGAGRPGPDLQGVALLRSPDRGV